MKEETSKCPECGFEGELSHRWSGGDFLVVCPSCGAITHKVEKEKIDDMVTSVMAEALAEMRETLDDKKG